MVVQYFYIWFNNLEMTFCHFEDWLWTIEIERHQVWDEK